MSSDKKNKCTNLCRHISSTAGKLLGIEDTLLLISFECVCSSRGTFRRNIILPKPLPPADWRWWSREYRWKGRDSGLSGSTVRSLSSPDPDVKSFSNAFRFWKKTCLRRTRLDAARSLWPRPWMSTSSCLDVSVVSIVKILDVSMQPSWKDYYLEQTVKLSSLEMIKRKIIYLSICWRPSCSSLSLSTLFILCIDD